MTVLPFALALAGVAAMAAVMRARARREALVARVAIDGLFVMIAAGLVAGHAADVLLTRGAQLGRDLSLLLPGSGGSSSAGALAGVAIAGVVWFRRRAAGRGLAYADTFALGGSLGLALVRLGCFACHDHLSAVTDSPFALSFAGGARHDLGLDEALLCFALFALLATIDRVGEAGLRLAEPGAGGLEPFQGSKLDRRPRRAPDGTLFAVAALVYGAGRFGLDCLRVHDPRAAGLTAAQFVALVLVTLGAGWLARSRGNPRVRPLS